MSEIKAGSTDQSIYFVLLDATTGAPATGLTIANLDATYTRTRATAVKNDLTALGAANSAHTDNQAIEVDATNAPGLYRIDFPDAAFASGVAGVALSINGAAIKPAHKEFLLVVNTAEDIYTRLGAPAGASVSADIAGIQSDTNDIQTRLPAALVSGRMDASVGAMAANTLTASALATDAVDEIVDGVWDEVITGASHNNATSAGRRLRLLSDVIIHDGTAQGPGTGTNQIQLDTGASATSGAYDPGIISIISGTGAGQSRLILQYDGASRTATVDRDWRTNPDATSVFQVTANPGREHVNEGLAQGGSSDTITLNANASATNGAYIGQIVFIRSGTGSDQVGLVTAYNGATKVATIHHAWPVAPDSTSGYSMLPGGPVMLAGITHTNAVIPTVSTVTSIDAAAETGIADALLNRDMSAVSDTNARSPLNALRFIRNKWDVAAGTLTVKKEDDTTTAWTASVSTSAGAEPIIGNDPA